MGSAHGLDGLDGLMFASNDLYAIFEASKLKVILLLNAQFTDTVVAKQIRTSKRFEGTGFDFDHAIS